VIRTELDLSGYIEENVCVLPEFGETSLEPVEIGLEVLDAEEHTAVRAQLVFAHRVIQGDKLRYINCAGVRKGVVRGVEIDNGDGSTEGGEELVFAIASGWTCLNRHAPQTISPKGTVVAESVEMLSPAVG
jgi:hypothetical protein